jgi:hypothetical protein
MANKHMKKCSPSLAIKEMQIQTTLRFHLTAVKMLPLTQTSPTAGEDAGEKGTLIQCWWNVNECNCLEDIMKVPQKY